MNLKNWFKGIFCKEIGELIRYLEKKDECIELLEDESKILNDVIKQLQKKVPKDNKLEKKLNGKYPSRNITYTGRWVPYKNGIKKMSMDVRGFFINPNKELKNIITSLKLNDRTDDEKARLIQKWVVDKITYVHDKSQYGMDEFWAFPQETLVTKRGDCDDGAILMAWDSIL